MEPQETKSNLNVPIAIVLAGIVIAGAIYFKDKSKETIVPTKTGEPTPAIELNVPPFSSDDHILGSPTSPITFFEYSDFDCPFCKNFHPVTQKLVEKYGKAGSMALVYRHFPLRELHPNAPKKAEASECAAELGGNDMFWKFADVLFSGPAAHANDPTAELVAAAEKVGLNSSAFKKCLDSGRYTAEVEKQYTEAVSAGGRGTPFNVLVLKKEITANMKEKIAPIFAQYPPGTYAISADGKKIALNGALPLESIEKTLDILIAEK